MCKGTEKLHFSEFAKFSCIYIILNFHCQENVQTSNATIETGEDDVEEKSLRSDSSFARNFRQAVASSNFNAYKYKTGADTNNNHMF